MIHIGNNGFKPDFKNENHSYDLSQLERNLLRMDYESIISDSHFFWQLYCFTQSEAVQKPTHLFSVKKLVNNTIIISGKDAIIKKVREGVEEIRKHLIKRENITLFTVQIDADIYLKEECDIINFSDWKNPSSFKIYDQFYNRFIRPHLPLLVEKLGATCKEFKKNQKINHGDGEVNEMILHGLTIEWKSEALFVYPIEPIEIHDREGFEPVTYTMQQENILCDLKIITLDGFINAHSLIVYAYGKEVMQKILTTGMKESREGEINLKAYPTATVRIFVDYLYLGTKELTKKYLKRNHSDFHELFKLAHTFQIPNLIDCCTNLIALTASENDYQSIKELAEKYDNQHLKDLAEYFANKQLFIKV